jgi:hypothetical protein
VRLRTAVVLLFATFSLGIVAYLAFVVVVLGAKADGWCMTHMPRRADGYGTEWSWKPPHWNCVYERLQGERIQEIGREGVYSR